MSNDNLLKIRAFIDERFLFGRDDIYVEDDDSLLDRGIIDSTGVLELVAFLEESFNVNVEDDELVPENLDSISRAAAFVAKKTTTH